MMRKRLSDILIEQAEGRGDRARAEQLRHATAVYYAAEESRYGEYLVAEHIITPVELEIALARQCVLCGDLVGAEVHARRAERALDPCREEGDLHVLALRTIAAQFDLLAMPARMPVECAR